MALRDHSQLIPLFGALLWFATLWGMLITWLTRGRPHYVSMDKGQTIAYISDVGADFLKPLFVVACCITSATFVASLCLERWFRHRGRLLPNLRRREKIGSTLAIIGSIIGGAGLILLSVFDTKRHPRLHRLFLLVYMIGVAMSAVFTVAEFAWLRKDFNYHAHLRRAYMYKAVIVFIMVAAAIPFGALLYTKHQNIAACLEWGIAFMFTFYLLTFWYDLRQAKYVKDGAKGGRGTGTRRRRY